MEACDKYVCHFSRSSDTTGISKLCEQLSLDPYEDVRVLVLLYKLGANSKPSQITREEWIEGCHTLKLDSIAKFKAFLPQLDTGFMAREEFSDFFKVGMIEMQEKLGVMAS